MFSWNETVAIALVGVLRDPELITYFMSILKPKRRDFIEDEARIWHESLRVSKEDRWKNVSDLSKARKFSKFNLQNSSVPITCKLPFDGEMWRNSCSLLKSILYFRKGFLKFPGGARTRRLDGYEEEMSYKQKVNTVNLMLGETIISQKFRDQWSLRDTREALVDFIHFEDTSHAYQGDPILENEEKPFIIVEEETDNKGEYQSIMNIIN